jgi:hypothetical protein
MSYVLHIWEKPIPQDTEEAWNIIDELYDEKDESLSPEWFRPLAARLIEKYPLHIDPENPLGVWIDNSLEKQSLGYLLYCLGIRSSDIEEVQPFVVKTANELGLVCYDMQEDQIYS